MHPPQWTHYQLALCFQHTLHTVSYTHADKKKSTARAHTLAESLITILTVVTFVHRCTHSHTAGGVEMSHRRAYAWRESVLNVCTRTAHTHQKVTRRGGD